jgi:hypothetical protein
VPGPFAAAAEHELDLGCEENHDREPDGDPRAKVVAEEPRHDEHEGRCSNGGLERAAIELVPHGGSVRVVLRK